MLQRMYIIIFLVLFSGCASINSTPFQAFKDNVNYVQKAMAKATNSNQQIIANNFIKNANPKDIKNFTFNKNNGNNPLPFTNDKFGNNENSYVLKIQQKQAELNSIILQYADLLNILANTSMSSDNTKSLNSSLNDAITNAGKIIPQVTSEQEKQDPPIIAQDITSLFSGLLMIEQRSLLKNDIQKATKSFENYTIVCKNLIDWYANAYYKNYVNLSTRCNKDNLNAEDTKFCAGLDLQISYYSIYFMELKTLFDDLNKQHAELMDFLNDKHHISPVIVDFKNKSTQLDAITQTISSSSNGSSK